MSLSDGMAWEKEFGYKKVDNNVKFINSNPDTNTFLLRCFREIKDSIVIDKLNNEDKTSYYDCCRILAEYEKLMIEMEISK